MEKDIDGATLKHLAKAVDMSGKRVLEVGCGDGRITMQYADLPRTLVAVDPYGDAVALARHRYPHIDFRVMSGDALGFADNSFDLVLFTLSLHHQDAEAALAEAERILAPGGSAVAIEPVAETEIDRICTVLNDERAALARTLDILRNGPWAIAHEETFRPQWRFEQATELHQHLFDYYSHPWDESVVRQVNAILGAKVADSPLLIEDELRLLHLYPPA